MRSFGNGVITKSSYNEGTKLTASFINLIAVGLLTAGVTTPLVGAFYGAQIWGDESVPLLILGSLFWLAMALVVHIAALLLLRSLIE